MSKHVKFFLYICLLTNPLGQFVFSQISFDTIRSVKASATVDYFQPAININWIIDPGSSKYEIFRKTPSSSNWGTAIFTGGVQDSVFHDTNVDFGKLYEYRIKKLTGDQEGNAYLYSGIDYFPKSENKHILLIIEEETRDSTFAMIESYKIALFKEAWIVHEEIIHKDSSVQSVKNKIIEAKDKFRDLSSVLLIGNIPTPHSGNINPDAHSDHIGGWPADLYYGDLDGHWTDYTVNNTTSSNPRNHNIPGDGNLDQDFIPDSIDLAIGRIDFSELPVYDENEYQLLRNYLRKNIAYRRKEYVPRPRAVFKNRNPYSEGLGQNAIRNFSVLVSPDSIVYEEFFDAFYDSFLWSYGASSGSQTSSLGLGNIETYAQNNFQSTFTGYFGSYYGDYDFENNFLRTVLASGKVLTTAWIGAPHWFFHPMAMGETMGFCTLLTQNNKETYHAGDFPGSVHINLLGDPTLKSFILPPPSDLLSITNGNAVTLEWEHSSEDLLGFNIYRWLEDSLKFTRLNFETIVETSFTDSCASRRPTNHYLVRAVKREITPSGSFINESGGLSIKVESEDPISPIADFDILAKNDTLRSLNLSKNANHFLWQLSNGMLFPTDNFDLTFSTPEPLEISLIAYNACFSDTITKTYTPSSLEDFYPNEIIDYRPNPLLSGENLDLNLKVSFNDLTIFNSSGNLLQNVGYLKKGENRIKILADVPGLYLLKFTNANTVITKRLLIIN